jgi:hypothetical protein
MLDLILGIAAAIGASTLYSLGVALQAIDAKRAPHEAHLRLGLARNLIVRPRWLLGTGLSMLGWPLQVVALLLAPLVVVQPTLAAGLLVLLVFGQRMLGEHAGRRERLAVAAIVLGVVGTALGAPQRSESRPSDETITLVLVGLGALAMLPYLVSLMRRHPPASLTMIGAGLGFAWSGVATKLASDGLSQGRLALAAAWGVSTAGASAVGALSEMSAMQKRPAIQVAPVVFVTQTVVPIVLAPLLLESFKATPLGGAPLGLALAVLVLGAAALARSPLLLALMEGEGAISSSSGSTRSPRERTQETIRSRPRSDEGEPSADTTSTSPARG